MRRILIIVIAVLVLIIGGLFALKAKQNSLQPASPAPGQLTTDLGEFSVEIFENGAAETLTLSNLMKKSGGSGQAKVLLINFWASWCEACIAEMPSINALYDDFKDKGFLVLGVNLDENPKAVAPKYVKMLNMKFPIGIDPDNKLSEALNVSALPHTVIIDVNGKILHSQSGEDDWNSSENRQRVETWIKP